MAQLCMGSPDFYEMGFKYEKGMTDADIVSNYNLYLSVTQDDYPGFGHLPKVTGTEPEYRSLHGKSLANKLFSNISTKAVKRAYKEAHPEWKTTNTSELMEELQDLFDLAVFQIRNSVINSLIVIVMLVIVFL